MKLRIERFEISRDGKATVGRLYVDEVLECYTLEDQLRPVGEKVKGATAIPAGTYEVIVDFSARFKRLMPHVLNVPMFEGIRIHSGNTDADTEGCILLGQTHTAGQNHIENSRLAFEAFFKKLQAAPEKVILTIG